MEDTPAAPVDPDRPLPRRRDGLQVAEFDGELVVLDPARMVVHHLEGLSAVVFDACDGTVTRAELVAEFMDSLELDAEDARQEIDTLEALLDSAVLLEGSVEPDDGPPCLGCGGETIGEVHPRRWFAFRR